MIDSTFVQNSLAKIWDQLIAWLPTLLVGLILLILGWVFARVLSALVSKLLRRLGVDEIFQRVGLTEGFNQAGVTKSASELIGLVIFWLVFLSFILLAFEQFGLTAIVSPLQHLIGYLPHILAAAIVLIAGAFLAQFLGKVAQAAAAGMGIEFHQTLGRLVRGLLLVITAFLAIDQLGIDLSLLTDTFINVLTVIAAGLVLAFALGARGVAGNVLAGYYAREQFSLGERVVVDDQEGVLDAIGTLNAEIVIGNDRLFIPNSRLIDNQITVLSQTKGVDSAESHEA